MKNKNKEITILILMIFAVLVWMIPVNASAPTTVKDFQNKAVEGLLPLHTFYFQHATIDATTTEYVVSNNLAPDYPFRDAAGTFEVSSSDASDLGTIEITYLDVNKDIATVELDLDGQTAVDGGVSAWRFISAKLVYDTKEVNAGDIYVFYDSSLTAGVPDDSTSVFLKINAEESISKMAVFSVPRNVTAVIQNMYISGVVDDSATETITGVVYSAYDSNGERIIYILDEVTLGNLPHLKFNSPIEIPAESDIWMGVESSDASSSVRAGFAVYLIEEE